MLPLLGSTQRFSWSGNCPSPPRDFPFPLKVEICVSPVDCQWKPPSVERFMSNAMPNGPLKLNDWQT